MGSRTTKHPDTWVIVPAYNEAGVIASVIAEVQEQFQNIVVIDDCSSDGTSRTIENQGIAKCVRHSINLGQGAAISTGFKFAFEIGAEYVVTFDADGQHKVSDAEDMLNHLVEKELDVVLGSRFIGTVSSSLPKAKKYLLLAATKFTRMSSGLKVTDTHNGLRALNRKAFTSISINQNRMAHASEILTEIGKKKLRYEEHPVEIIYTQYSIAKGQRISNAINILFELFEGRMSR